MALLAATFSDESARPSAIRAKMPATVNVFIAYNIETSVTMGCSRTIPSPTDFVRRLAGQRPMVIDRDAHGLGALGASV